jgi:hypothetical protein
VKYLLGTTSTLVAADDLYPHSSQPVARLPELRWRDLEGTGADNARS